MERSLSSLRVCQLPEAHVDSQWSSSHHDPAILLWSPGTMLHQPSGLRGEYWMLHTVYTITIICTHIHRRNTHTKNTSQMHVQCTPPSLIMFTCPLSNQLRYIEDVQFLFMLAGWGRYFTVKEEQSRNVTRSGFTCYYRYNIYSD